MAERWAELEHYPGYAVSTEGRVLNMKLNKILTGTKAGDRRIVSVRSADGYFHSFSTKRLMELVDFDKSEVVVDTRQVLCLETGKLYRDAAHAARELLTDASTVHKVLRGEREKVKGVTLRYVYGGK